MYTVCSVVPKALDHMECSPPGSSVHGIFPGKNTGVGCHFLLHLYIYIYTYICIYTYAYIYAYVYTHTCTVWTSQVELVVKNLLANAGNLIRDLGLISGSRTSGGGHATHSCLDYPMDKGAWTATVHRVKKCQTWLKRFSLHAYTVYIAVCTWHSKSP